MEDIHKVVPTMRKPATCHGPYSKVLGSGLFSLMQEGGGLAMSGWREVRLGIDSR